MAVFIKSLGILGRPTGSSTQLLQTNRAVPKSAPSEPARKRISDMLTNKGKTLLGLPDKSTKSNTATYTEKKSYVVSNPAPQSAALGLRGSTYLLQSLASFTPFGMMARSITEAQTAVSKVGGLPVKYYEWRKRQAEAKTEAERAKAEANLAEAAARAAKNFPAYPVEWYDPRRLLPDYAYYADDELEQGIRTLYSGLGYDTTGQATYVPPQTSAAPLIQVGSEEGVLGKYGKYIVPAGIGIAALFIIAYALKKR